MNWFSYLKYLTQRDFKNINKNIPKQETLNWFECFCKEEKCY